LIRRWQDVEIKLRGTFHTCRVWHRQCLPAGRTGWPTWSAAVRTTIFQTGWATLLGWFRRSLETCFAVLMTHLPRGKILQRSPGYMRK
jgi:hypothetical protein